MKRVIESTSKVIFLLKPLGGPKRPNTHKLFVIFKAQKEAPDKHNANDFTTVCPIFMTVFQSNIH